LALAVLEADPEAKGLLCFEEPENGIHPERIVAMLDLLQDLAVDAESQVGEDNPLRQVIVNTHSPVVVSQVPDDSLLFAETVSRKLGSSEAVFRPLSGTWRSQAQGEQTATQRGRVLAFLNPVRRRDGEHRDRGRRVIDRDEFQPSLPFRTS
jgi:hypothetical protein